MITDPNGINAMLVSFLRIVRMNDAFKNDFEFCLLLNLVDKLPVDFVVYTVNEWLLFLVWSEKERNSHVLENLKSHIRRKLVPVVSASFSECLRINCDGQCVKIMFLDKFNELVCVLGIFQEVKLHYLETVFVVFRLSNLWDFSGWHHTQSVCGFPLSCYFCWN